MKTQTLPALLACAAALLAAPAALANLPIYEETFNVGHTRLEYRSGAGLGVPGSGVSGKTGDRAYVATPRSSEQEPNGPAAIAASSIAPSPLSAFTCAFWYYLEENGPVLQVPVNTAGFMLLLHERGFELRVEQSNTNPKQLAFTPGISGPHAGWRDTGRWIFASFSWDQTTNTVFVHQGLPDKAVAFMRDMSRDVAAKPTLPREDLGRNPETIGNTHIRFDRPLAGRMDNLRIFDRVLTRAELERIRQADIANEPLSYK